ncbi:MAG TPA: S1 RNA-binding domain-containing protein, partial [Methanobacteriaceae archaeon]|nr:S1 RNA-binding domain-containing protein [Methanobacteriaceae archaeon]
MKKTCLECKGKGHLITSYQICESCHGSGVSSQVDLQDHVKGLPRGARERYQLDVDEEVPCPECKGKGELEIKKTCPTCHGQGELNHCQKCGKQIDKGDYCEDCRSKQIVYQLHPSSDLGDLEVGAVYKGRVTKVVDFGVFVTFTKKVYGLMRMRASSYQVGDEVFARVTEIKTHRGEVDLEPARIN